MLLYSMKALNYHASKKHHQLKFCDYKKQNQFFFNNKRIFIGRTLEVGHRIEVQNQTLESCGKDKNQDSFRFLSLRNSQVWLSSTFPSADSGKSQRCLLNSQILGREKLAHKEKKKTKAGPGSHICLTGQDQEVILEEGRVVGKHSRKTKTISATVMKISLRD